MTKSKSIKDWGDTTKDLGDDDGFPTANEHKWDDEPGHFYDDVLGTVDICTQRHLPNSDPANESKNQGKDNYSYQDQPWDRGEGNLVVGGDFTYEDDPQEKHRGE